MKKGRSTVCYNLCLHREHINQIEGKFTLMYAHTYNAKKLQLKKQPAITAENYLP